MRGKNREIVEVQKTFDSSRHEFAQSAAKRYHFLSIIFFVPRTHVLVQILVIFGGIFFGGKLKVDVRRIVMGMYTERCSDNFRRSQDESQSDGEIIV